jgi:hypothetical protein
LKNILHWVSSPHLAVENSFVSRSHCDILHNILDPWVTAGLHGKI